jgi:hypothetical protein
MSDYPEHVDQIQEQDSEITRLRDLVAVYKNTVKFSDAELTRLRFELSEAKKAGTPYWAERDSQNALIIRNQNLERSNAELLAACQELSKLYHYRVSWGKFRPAIERAEAAIKHATGDSNDLVQ